MAKLNLKSRPAPATVIGKATVIGTVAKTPAIKAGANAIPDMCKALVAALHTGRDAIEAASKAFDLARVSQVTMVVDACKRITAPVTEPVWLAQYAAPVKALLIESGQYADMSVNTKLSELKACVIAITGGILPKPEHTSLSAFVKFARGELTAKGLVDPTGKGKGGKAPSKGGGQGRKPTGGSDAGRKASATTLSKGMGDSDAFQSNLLLIASPKHAVLIEPIVAMLALCVTHEDEHSTLTLLSEAIATFEAENFSG